MRQRSPPARWLRPLGFVLLVIAALGQIGSGGLASGMPQIRGTRSTADTAFAGLMVICHAGAPVGSGDTAPAHHRGGDCALCPLCLSLAAPVAILLPAPVLLPRPAMAVVQPPLLPPARAPPATVLAIAYPRGPPVLI